MQLAQPRLGVRLQRVCEGRACGVAELRVPAQVERLQAAAAPEQSREAGARHGPEACRVEQERAQLCLGIRSQRLGEGRACGIAELRVFTGVQKLQAAVGPEHRREACSGRGPEARAFEMQLAQPRLGVRLQTLGEGRARGVAELRVPAQVELLQAAAAPEQLCEAGPGRGPKARAVEVQLAQPRLGVQLQSLEDGRARGVAELRVLVQDEHLQAAGAPEKIRDAGAGRGPEARPVKAQVVQLRLGVRLQRPGEGRAQAGAELRVFAQIEHLQAAVSPHQGSEGFACVRPHSCVNEHHLAQPRLSVLLQSPGQYRTCGVADLWVVPQVEHFQGVVDPQQPSKGFASKRSDARLPEVQDTKSGAMVPQRAVNNGCDQRFVQRVGIQGEGA